MDLGTLKITDFVLELYVVKCYRAPVNGEEPLKAEFAPQII